jgi:Bacterial PH domain
MMTTAPYYDKKEQLQKIEAALLPGEQALAVFEMKGGGTSFIGITTKRVIVYQKAFMGNMKAIVSIPFSRIISVAAEDDSGVLTRGGFFSGSKLVLTTSTGALEFEFRGSDKAQNAHNLILGPMLG